MVLIDETIYVLGSHASFDGRLLVECYDEERDKWNDRTAMPMEKIAFKQFRLPRDHLDDFYLKICSTYSCKLLGLLPI